MTKLYRFLNTLLAYTLTPILAAYDIKYTYGFKVMRTTNIGRYSHQLKLHDKYFIRQSFLKLNININIDFVLYLRLSDLACILGVTKRVYNSD